MQVPLSLSHQDTAASPPAGTSEVRWFPPPKLQRLTRRKLWRCRSVAPKGRPFRVLTMQLAGYAVVLHDAGCREYRVWADKQRRRGGCDAAWQSLTYPVHDPSEAAREAAERDCLAIRAGLTARFLLLGFGIRNFVVCTQPLWDLLKRIERDSVARRAWYEYILERSRAMLAEGDLWARMERVAARLGVEPEMDAVRVAAILAHGEDGAAVVPIGVPREPDEPRPQPRSNAELLWQAPTLTRILGVR